MAARHEQRVFRLEEAHLASAFFVVVIVCHSSLTLRCTFLLLHAVDGLDFERHSVDLNQEISITFGDTYEDDLLVDLDSLNLVVSIANKHAIVNESVLLAALCVINAANERVVLANVLCQSERDKVVQIELHLLLVNFLAHSRVESHLLHVVSLVGCEEPMRIDGEKLVERLTSWAHCSHSFAE